MNDRSDYAGSFHIGNRSLLQAHFILEETQGMQSAKNRLLLLIPYTHSEASNESRDHNGFPI